MNFRSLLLLSALAVFVSGCQQPAAARVAQAAANQPVQVSQQPLHAPTQPCTGAFAMHDLPFTAALPNGEASTFDANGAGAAIGDLDGDGRLDVVLANQRGPDTILWNAGGMQFRAEPMAAHDSRAVNLVDVDGDGLLDIVFTQRHGAPNWWRNSGTPGAERFARELLPGVASPAYAMAWGDMDGDNRLDLVTGSYDVDLLNQQRGSFGSTSSGTGVYLYRQTNDGFTATQLTRSAQTLALALYDVNNDGQRDIVAGNDFAVPDAAWTRQTAGWTAATPFRTTSYSTMSFDIGDVDNSGALALFSTDMKPYDQDVATLARWQPIATALWQRLPALDPQRMENALQVPDGRSGFNNGGYDRGVDATGWSWSGEFGDLDNDGWQDIYVANGMQESTLLRYMPGHELVERNQALRNTGGGHFAPAPEWELGATAGGRGMSIADLDGDGDLDIVVNNLRGPAQLFENRLCGGVAVLLDLRWPGSGNTVALGATATLHTSAGNYTREVHAATGYLSGAAPQLHFGVPTGATVTSLEIRWPDGATSSVNNMAAGTHVTVTRP